jgi:hypothetical protein
MILMRNSILFLFNWMIILNVVDYDLHFTKILHPVLFVHAGQEAAIENAHLVVNCLTGLIAYPHKMVLNFSSKAKQI